MTGNARAGNRHRPIGHADRMEFTYRVTGNGWSRARIADDETWAELSASYLSDALGDLLEAVGLILEGAAEARCSWQEEPGEYRWIFTREGPDVRLRILDFADQVLVQPDNEGRLAFETVQPAAVMASAIADGAEAVLSEMGESAYLAEWIDAPFPTAHLGMIRERL